MRARERLQVLEGPADVARAGAEEVLARASAATRAHGAFHLALAGGSTPRGVYRELATRASLDPGTWHLWFGDERCVPPAHADSNFRMVQESGLLERVSAHQVHRLRGETPEVELEAERYARELVGVLGSPPRLDLALLGLGADGHTASLFPGTSALDARTWVAAGRAPVAPTRRLTMTLPLLAEARAILFLVSGSEKVAALGSALGDVAPPSPARRVQPRDGELLWLVDRSALPTHSHLGAARPGQRVAVEGFEPPTRGS